MTPGSVREVVEAPVRILTVAIPTFRRPGQLSRLLEVLPSCLSEVPSSIRAEVLVVDNDPDGSASEVVKEQGIAARYVVETTPGIAAARNRALNECRGSDFLAFIDDDEVPRPRWLPALIEVAEAAGATAVMGRVISVFDEDVDPWILASGTFRRPERPTGQILRTAAAGNLLLDLRQVRALGVRFDERLGLGGGEDTLFSRQLILRGGTIVWCNESVTEDTVVAARLTPAWVRQRAFSSANSTARVTLMLEPNAVRRLVMRGAFVGGGAARIAIGEARHAFGRVCRSRHHDARGVRLAYRGFGMVSAAFGHLHEEYHR